MTRSLALRLLAGRFAIAQLPPAATVPEWVDGEITCIARTSSELSIVCAENKVPDTVRANRAWRCMEVSGPLDFSEIGILGSLTKTLSTAAVSVFVFSTFFTDYVLVREEKLALAIDALEGAGHAVLRTDHGA